MRKKLIAMVLASVMVLPAGFPAAAEELVKDGVIEEITGPEIFDEEVLKFSDEDILESSEEPEEVYDILSSGEDKASERSDTDTQEIDDRIRNNTTTVIYKLRDEGSGNLRIYWRYKSNVDGFQIRFSTDSTFSKDVRYAYYTGRNNVTRQDLSLGQTWYVQVRTVMYNSGVRYNSPWSGTKSMMLSRTLPGTVLDSARGNGQGISAVWDRSESAQGYQLMYADNAEFKNAVTACVRNRKKNSFTKYTRISPSQNWFVRIRTYNTAEDGERYYSAWSSPLYVPAWG